MMMQGIALLLLAALASPVLAQDRLPDGDIARASQGDIAQAWFGQPTTRYAHGVLGDRIEGGSLVVIDGSGARHVLTLPEHQVFEDRTPRLADLDGDGRTEIVTIRSNLDAGAAVAIYGLRDGQLVERTSTAPIGRANRWLSIAAIADFVAQPGLEIAIVTTPHIGGVLEILSLRGNRLASLVPAQTGYSTHSIGSRDISLARAEDVDGDGHAELALPSQNRLEVVVLSFAPTLRILARLPQAAPIERPIAPFAATLRADQNRQ